MVLCSVFLFVWFFFFFVIVPRGETHPVKRPVGNHCIHCIHLEAVLFAVVSASSFLVFVFVCFHFAFVLYIVQTYTLDFYLVYLATTLFRIAVPVLIPFPFKTRKIQARKGMILNLTKWAHIRFYLLPQSHLLAQRMSVGLFLYFWQRFQKFRRKHDHHCPFTCSNHGRGAPFGQRHPSPPLPSPPPGS